MVFSSTEFLFIFLPITLIGYFLIRKDFRNVFLLVMSLLFYAVGEPKFVFVMIGVVLLDWAFGIWADKKSKKNGSLKPVIILTAVCNVGLLFVFKYLNFTLKNLHGIFGDSVVLTNIALPIGISFFTFQAMSYVFDVCSGKGKVQKNPLNVLLYVCLFPQLVAGPIVRYQTVADEINERTVTLDGFAEGVQRFIIGLGKKAVLANTLGVTVDYCFKISNTADFTLPIAWLGAIGYSLQLYYDFSGYSDMAIGLGRMFGFHFEENFNYPYISGSVSEFWRRWHISMGTWFRDYIYFPLGGSRVKTKSRAVFNLFVVWLLTGIWHGANWTFIIWGLWHFIWIAFEKMSGLPNKFKNKALKIVYRIISLVVVVIGWVLFRADSISQAVHYIGVMLGISGSREINGIFKVLFKDAMILLMISIVFSVPIIRFIQKKCEKHNAEKGFRFVMIISSMALFMISIGFCNTTSYDPFIYFNF